MQVSDRIFKPKDLEKKLQLYLLFCSYYYQGFWQLEQWPEIVELLANFLNQRYQDKLAQGVRKLENIGQEDLEASYYEYHRLFIGPGKLQAPPFESSYRNPEGLVMQKETLAVRRFYHQAGLAVREQGRYPDDHLAFELEFICYLLSRLLRFYQEKGFWEETYQQWYLDFYQRHLGQWIFSHCQDVLAHSSTPIIQGMGWALWGFMELEKQELDLIKGGM